jgi:4-amino-4-deoxy-L-arabinose transferase-like glycosyltransferase
MSSGGVSPRAAAWAVAAIAVLALALRLWSLAFGLPGIYNMDEKPILDRALTFAKGDPNPHNFLYPTLYLYALFAWEGLFFVAGRIAGAFDSLAAFRDAYFVDPSAHVLAARALTALVGAATTGAAYWYGSRLYNRAVGLAAALFLAVAPLAVRDAHYVKLDLPVTFFTVLAHAALAAIVVDPGRAARRRSWVVAGLLAGLAISTQYYAAFLAVPFLAVGASDVRRSGRWQASARLLLWAGLATAAGFVAGSPFFLLEPSTVIRDFTELREVDIDRAVSAGLFSSAAHYAGILFRGALGVPVFLLALLGAVLSLRHDWTRGLLLLSFPLAFLLFVSNTFPASRYLNIVLPSFCVAAGYGAWRLAALAGSRAPLAMAATCVLAAIPGAYDSVRWNVFFGQDDTRTMARAFIERTVPASSTVLVQPYSAPIRQSREALAEALTARLGDLAHAPLKHQLQLAAASPPGPAYRVLYVGESGKTQAVPGDVDKIYISPRAVTPGQGLAVLREAGVEIVVLTHYGTTPAAFTSMVAALERDARRLVRFSPYRGEIDPATAPVPPFRHNGNTWIHPMLERPGPVVEIWQIE